MGRIKNIPLIVGFCFFVFLLYVDVCAAELPNDFFGVKLGDRYEDLKDNFKLYWFDSQRIYKECGCAAYYARIEGAQIGFEFKDNVVTKMIYNKEVQANIDIEFLKNKFIKKYGKPDEISANPNWVVLSYLSKPDLSPAATINIINVNNRIQYNITLTMKKAELDKYQDNCNKCIEKRQNQEGNFKIP